MITAEPVHEKSLPGPTSTPKGLGQPERSPLASSLSPTDTTLRANSFPEVTDLFWRLPSTTLFYQLEPAHLGDLLRLWVRPDKKGPSKAHRTAQEVWGFTGRETVSPAKPISWWQYVKKKRKLFPGLSPTSPSSVALPLVPLGGSIPVLVREYFDYLIWLSDLIICYYHQDLHQRPFQPGSRQRLRHDLRALLLVVTWCLFRRPSIGATLERNLFSRLGDSACELLHSLADPDFHGHRPAVKISQHLLWCLSVDLGTLTRRSVHLTSQVRLTIKGPLRTSPLFHNLDAVELRCVQSCLKLDLFSIS